MNASDMSYDKCLGLFFLFGGVVELKDSSKEFYEDAIKYFFEDSFGVIPRTCEERENISQAQIRKYVEALLTWTHEIHHLFLFFSSPLSLLTHQLLTIRSSYIQHMCMFANRSSISFPIRDSKDANLSSIIEIIKDIDFVKDVVFGDSCRPLGEVIRKCNEVFSIVYQTYQGYFGHTMELLKITSDLCSNAFSSPSEKITTLRLFESYSQLTEAAISGQLNLEVSSHVEVLDDMVANTDDVYSDAFDYFLSKLSIDCPEYYHISTFFLSVEISLKTPMGLNYFGISKSMKWEDLHPSYRFEKIISKIKELGFFKNPKAYREYSDSLCKLLRWPSISKIAKRSSEIEYVSTTKGGLKAFSEPMIDALSKYVVAIHKVVNDMNHKWPGAHLNAYDNMKYLEYFNKHFKPPFSIAGGKFVRYDDCEIFLPRLKEFLLYILSFDVYYSSDHHNFDYFRNVLFNSYANFAHLFKDEMEYKVMCAKIVKGCLKSLRIENDL